MSRKFQPNPTNCSRVLHTHNFNITLPSHPQNNLKLRLIPKIPAQYSLQFSQAHLKNCRTRSIKIIFTSKNEHKKAQENIKIFF